MEISLIDHALVSLPDLRWPGHPRVTTSGTEPSVSASGGDLYRIVCDYASLGPHRSGTDRDVETAEWFADLVSHLGPVTTLRAC